MELAERKRVALSQKLDALDAEFSEWRTLSAEHGPFEKHHTQVIALTSHLTGLRDATRQIFDGAIKEAALLDEARNIESLVLGMRRIWEFFRSKLVQRHDPGLRPFLQAADELSWACYKPMLDICSDARREPPLVFLNGGLSPYALSRDQAFPAEAVPGEPLGGNTYDPVLEKLPIPVIGVPWYQVAHLPDLPVVAHETGHAVEQDFGLHKSVVANLTSKLAGTKPGPAAWEAWSKEVFADLWGCLTLGPAYVSSLVDFLAASRKAIQGEVAGENNKYPTAYTRIVMCAHALDRMGFTTESAKIATAWKTEYPKDDTDTTHETDYVDDEVLERAVDAILVTKLAHKKLDKPLIELGDDVVFSANDWKWAKDGAQKLVDDGDPTAIANTIKRWTAAARHLYDSSPDKYASKKYGGSLLTYSKQLVHPGTRAGEGEVTKELKDSITQASLKTGADSFNDFAAWARPQVPG